MSSSSKLTTSYRCASCGRNLVFDPDKGKLVCDSCGYSCELEAMEDDSERDFETVNETTTAGAFSEGSAVEFHCQNCGAVLITDKYTSATMCSYCDSPIFLSERLSDKLAPAYAIPFSINADDARLKFTEWAKKRKVIPTSFIKNDRLKDMQGVYVPFWLYDVNGRGDVSAHCTRVSSRVQGDYRITTTRHYDVYRKVEVEYVKIPVDASEKMIDEYMDMIEPFDYSKLTKFDMGYLAGFTAEKYTYDDKALLPRLTSRVSSYVRDFVGTTIRGYTTKVITRESYSAQQRNASYTLLPVYVLNYDHEGKTYSFMMNGQTGKIVGKPPISKLKCAGFFAGSALLAFGVALLGAIAVIGV
ncbi:MAG: TFIIB-type zinc ribbon-containing protein [Bacillota bacterium]